MMNRRLFFSGLAASLAAPSIVRASSLAPISMLTWREARRTVSVINIYVTISPNPEYQRFCEETQKALLGLISSAGPIPYNDDGWKMIAEAAAKVPEPSPYIYKFSVDPT